MVTGQTYDLLKELDLLEPTATKLFHDRFSDLYLQRDGCVAVGPLTLVRAFPFSDIDGFLILKDAQERQVGMLRRVQDLDQDSRAVIEDELQWTYFAATITAVHSVEDHHVAPRWRVETNRGPRTFDLRSSPDNIRILPSGRVFLRDADGNRYQIPHIGDLDRVSRSALEEWL